MVDIESDKEPDARPQLKRQTSEFPLRMVGCIVGRISKTPEDFATGVRVVRGPGWDAEYADQDGGPGGMGTIVTGYPDAGQYVEVKWDNDYVGIYRCGEEDMWDLAILHDADPSKELQEAVKEGHLPGAKPTKRKPPVVQVASFAVGEAMAHTLVYGDEHKLHVMAPACVWSSESSASSGSKEEEKEELGMGAGAGAGVGAGAVSSGWWTETFGCKVSPVVEHFEIQLLHSKDTSNEEPFMKVTQNDPQDMLAALGLGKAEKVNVSDTLIGFAEQGESALPSWPLVVPATFNSNAAGKLVRVSLCVDQIENTLWALAPKLEAARAREAIRESLDHAIPSSENTITSLEPLLSKSEGNVVLYRFEETKLGKRASEQIALSSFLLQPQASIPMDAVEAPLSQVLLATLTTLAAHFEHPDWEKRKTKPNPLNLTAEEESILAQKYVKVGNTWARDSFKKEDFVTGKLSNTCEGAQTSVITWLLSQVPKWFAVLLGWAGRMTFTWATSAPLPWAFPLRLLAR